MVDDALGSLPLLIGMRVMVTENTDMSHGVVNGSQGTVRHVKYSEGEEGERYAECVYVHIEGCGMRCPGIENDVVPIFPVRNSFKYKSITDRKISMNREHVSLLPDYAFMDYKIQGRSLTEVVVEIGSEAEYELHAFDGSLPQRCRGAST